MQKIKPLIAAVAALTLMGASGCAGTALGDSQNKDLIIGSVLGAVAGGVTGKQVSRADGAPIVGAVIGAIAGGSVGGYMDKQREELKRKLAEEEAAKTLSIKKVSETTIKIDVSSDASFALGSSTLSPTAQATFAKVASTLKGYDKTAIHVVGNTDTLGSDASNQALSERRASAVASFFAGQGVDSQRLQTEGRGERDLAVATADNVNEPRNRRVDVFVTAVVQGNEAAAFVAPAQGM